LDADAGALLSDIGPSELRAFERRLDDLRAMRASSDARKGEPTITAGGEPVGIYANVDHPHLLETIDAASFDGVGLVRTEFLFQGGAFPDEDEQYGSYCSILRWAAGRPVTLRILDAGGDKPVPGLTIEGEPNPFLGVRGIRLFAQRPETNIDSMRWCETDWRQF
jgi:phosphotransferase system enzyme I (PtsI)